jgi:hypothetical protein
MALRTYWRIVARSARDVAPTSRRWPTALTGGIGWVRGSETTRRHAACRGHRTRSATDRSGDLLGHRSRCRVVVRPGRAGDRPPRGSVGGRCPTVAGGGARRRVRVDGGVVLHRDRRALLAVYAVGRSARGASMWLLLGHLLPPLPAARSSGYRHLSRVPAPARRSLCCAKRVIHGLAQVEEARACSWHSHRRGNAVAIGPRADGPERPGRPRLPCCREPARFAPASSCVCRRVCGMAACGHLLDLPEIQVEMDRGDRRRPVRGPCDRCSVRVCALVALVFLRTQVLPRLSSKRRASHAGGSRACP